MVARTGDDNFYGGIPWDRRTFSLPESIKKRITGGDTTNIEDLLIVNRPQPVSYPTASGFDSPDEQRRAQIKKSIDLNLPGEDSIDVLPFITNYLDLCKQIENAGREEESRHPLAKQNIEDNPLGKISLELFRTPVFLAENRNFLTKVLDEQPKTFSKSALINLLENISKERSRKKRADEFD